MKRSLSKLAVALLLAAAYAVALGPQATPPRTHLKVGDMAPDFSLPDQNGQTVRLSDFQGKQGVVLAFYVLAFTGG